MEPRVSEKDRSSHRFRDDREREKEKDKGRDRRRDGEREKEKDRDRRRDGDRDRGHRHREDRRGGDSEAEEDGDDRHLRRRHKDRQDEARRERSSSRVRESGDREPSEERRHSSRRRKEYALEDEIGNREPSAERRNSSSKEKGRGEEEDEEGERERRREPSEDRRHSRKDEEKRHSSRKQKIAKEVDDLEKVGDPSGERQLSSRKGKEHRGEDEEVGRGRKIEQHGEQHPGRKHDNDDEGSEPYEEGRHSSRKPKELNGQDEDGERERKRQPSEERYHTKKRKEHGGNEDGEREKKRERRRFEDRRADDVNGGHKVAELKLSQDDRNGKEGRTDMDLDFEGKGRNSNSVLSSGLTSKVPARELMKNSTSTESGYSLRAEVSSVTTTNENEGVSIRSDEVPGKSSTDGNATTAASKGGNLSLDALAKAKRALQLQKELSKKLTKLPVLNKVGVGTSSFSAEAGQTSDPGRSLALGTSISVVPPTATAQDAGSGISNSIAGIGIIPGLTSISKLEAVKRAQELAVKMGFRQDPEFAPLINMFPGASVEVPAVQRPAKAPVLRLDAQGREIDEHGNVINKTQPTNLRTLKVNINQQKREAFQIIRPDLDAIANSNAFFDDRMGINKTKLLRPKRPSFQFVEEGRLSKLAEQQRIKSQFGELQAKELKAKQAQLAKAKAEPDINPNLIAVAARVSKPKQKEEIPEIEWWDKVILTSGKYDDISEEKLNMDKITIYVEHPRPIEPPAEPAPPGPQPLKLTPKEQKKLRTQKRLAKEKDRQEMIRQGLLEPPKPKVKMSNLMRVLASEATQDPTRLEMEIRSAAAEREQAHVDRNIARKLTPSERREKKERKLFDDPNTLETVVSVYKIRDLSHPQTKFKVDVNAQENRLSGCAVIADGMTVVVVEGGRKSIKRYSKLMLNRIDWAAAGGGEDEDGERADAAPNSCVLVWQGSVAKPSFNKFLVHQCRSEAAARKVFADAGVPHYWDLSANFSDEFI